MRHVDEGTLHAYLDARDRPGAGALDGDQQAWVERHLAECATCAAELAGAERVRARAGDVLQGAGPLAPELPAFPTLTVPTAPSRRRTWVPLAWAASVLLAAGAGWLGSELWRTEWTRTAPAEAGAAAPAPARAELERPPADVLDAVAVPAAAQAAAEPAPAAARARPAGGAAAGAAAATSAMADAPAPQDAVGASAPLATAPMEQRGEVSADVRVAAPAPAAAVVPAPGEKTRAARMFAEPPAAAVQLESLVVTGAAHPYPGDADVAWTDIPLAEARRLLADTLLLVRGAEVERVARDSAGRVLVRQRLAAAEIELVQWRTPAPPEEAAASSREAGAPPLQGRAADGRPFAVVQRGGARVALKAAAGRVPSLLQQLERHRP